MPFQLHWEPEAAATYKKLEMAAKTSLDNRRASKKKKASKQEGLFKQIAKAIRLLRENPRHPSLCCHVYSSLEHPSDPSEKVWAAYAQNNTPGAYRIFWSYGPGQGWITILAITPHP